MKKKIVRPIKVKGWFTVWEVLVDKNYLLKMQERFRKYDLKK